jgi:hypothetical protein
LKRMRQAGTFIQIIDDQRSTLKVDIHGIKCNAISKIHLKKGESPVTID